MLVCGGFFLAGTAGNASARVSAIPAAIAARGDASATLAAAQRQFNSGNYTNAIGTLQSALAGNSQNAEIQYWLGRSYYELRDYDNAAAAAEKSVALDPKNSLYHQWLGRIYGGKADQEHSFFTARKVKKEFETAVQLNPSNISARRDLEEYCLEAPMIVGGSKDEAKAQVDAIAALDPIEGHLARGAFYARQKRPELAEKEYREVLNSSPSRLESYLEVADFFEAQNKPADMSTAVEAGAQKTGNDPRLAYYRGASRVLGGTESSQAEAYLKAYLASTPQRSDWPSHASARELLGQLYESQGKPADAAEQYRAALQLNPQMKAARLHLEKLEKASR